MALPTNTFTTYSAAGNREDLSDVIFRIDPTDTPFMTGIEKAKASAVNHEWQTQALAAANTANAQLEGDDAAADATTPTVRLGNICQISRKVPQVSGTQQAVEHAGRDNEMAYQEMLKGLELKRDMEMSLVGTNKAKPPAPRTSPAPPPRCCRGSSPRPRKALPAPIRRRRTAPARAPTAPSGCSARRSSNPYSSRSGTTAASRTPS
jgi:hypothetical protein